MFCRRWIGNTLGGWRRSQGGKLLHRPTAPGAAASVWWDGDFDQPAVRSVQARPGKWASLQMCAGILLSISSVQANFLFYGEQSVFVFYLNACWVLKIKVSSKCFTVYIRLGIHSIQGGPDIMAMVDWVSQTNYLRIPARRQLSSDYFGLIFGVVWKDKNGFPLYYEPSGFHFEMYFWSTVAFCCRATLLRPRQYLATCPRNWHLWKPRYKMHLSVR